MRKLSEKAAEFCRLIVYERESHARAYLHARYADTKNANVKAFQLLQKDYIQAEINRLNLVIAAEKLVDRNLMTKKYFDLAAVCNQEHDRPTQKGCLDSICKLYGLSIDVGAAGDSAMAEIDEARKAAAAAIPDEYFLNTPKLPELQRVIGWNDTIPTNPPSQDVSGLTGTDKSDATMPPCGEKDEENEKRMC